MLEFKTLRQSLLVSLLGLGLASALTASELAVYFGPRKAGDPNGLDTRAIEVINKAKKRLNCAVHELRLQSIADALIAAHKRGVQVRMVSEDRYFGNEFIKQVLDAGIPAIHDNNPNAIMHNKFVVADGEWVFTGSYNLTNTCSYDNYNNLVVIRDKAVAKIFDDEFEKLFAGHIYDENVNQETHKAVLKLKDREVPIEIFFQPRDRDSEEHVLEMLGTADQGIYVMQFAFFNGKVGQLLVDKHAQQKDVRAVIDFSMVFGDFQPFNAIGRLVEGKVPFSIGDDPHGKLHHKVFVVDPDGDNAMVLTGSANSSGAGFNKNAENIIVLHDKQIAKQYRDEALKLVHRLEHGSAVVKPRGLTGIGATHNFDVTIDAGGQPLKDIEITLPFHWRVKGIGSVNAWREDGPTLKPNLKLESRVPSRYTTIPVQMIVLKDVNLPGTGPASKATIRVKDLFHDPNTLPGKYSIYARGSDSSGKLRALSAMPIIWLFRTASENVGYMAGLLESRDVYASKSLEFLARDLDSSLGQEIEKGKIDAVKDFVFLLEKAKQENNPRFKIVAPILGGLSQKLAFAAQEGGAAAAEMKQLAARMKALLKR